MRAFIFSVLLFTAFILINCSGDTATEFSGEKSVDSSEFEEVSEPEKEVSSVPDDAEGGTIDFNNLEGRWELLYPGNYGYEFRFTRNYRAVVVLYLKREALVFRGVYNIVEDDKLKINIVEMKRTDNMAAVHRDSGFMKSKSSYFLLNASISEKDGGNLLTMRPEAIRIDGQESDGYLEPVLSLKKR